MQAAVSDLIHGQLPRMVGVARPESEVVEHRLALEGSEAKHEAPRADRSWHIDLHAPAQAGAVRALGQTGLGVVREQPGRFERRARGNGSARAGGAGVVEVLSPRDVVEEDAKAAAVAPWLALVVGS